MISIARYLILATGLCHQMADNVHFLATVTDFQAFLGRSRKKIQKYTKNTCLESLKWEQYALNAALQHLKYNKVAAISTYWTFK